MSDRCLVWLVFDGEVTDIHGRDRMVVGFATTYAISAYYHYHKF